MSRGKSLWLALAIAAFLVACNNGSAPASPSGTPATPARTVTPAPVETADAKDVALGARATFYGAEAGDGAGSVATGDFNGDGAVDLAMGAVKADGPDGGPSDVGAVYVFFAPFQPGEARDAARGDQDAAFYGAAPGDEAGPALAAGDLTGDGIDDLVIGAPFADGPGGRADAGAVYVVYGSPDLSGAAELAEGGADVTVSGAEAQDLAGLAVTVGDVSGDGVDDVIAGALWADGPENSRDQAGEAYVIFGRSEKHTSQLHSHL